jgi:A/G-specific adenine glycosylase
MQDVKQISASASAMDLAEAGVVGWQQKAEFRRTLLRWYGRHRRDLPWRSNRDAYPVWLSEVMLQQTRVNAVQDHYRRFLQRFPTVRVLAAAREASVLTAWSGLGYYRRARMLHQAAKMVCRFYDGEFPRTAAELEGLPGIGRYTARAVASIAFEEPVAVVDGNVERVLSRLRGRTLTSAECWAEAEALLDEKRPGDFNQALMELGATVCVPRAPKCPLCPVRPWCGTRGELPQGPPRRASCRQVRYSLDVENGKVRLVQRPANSRLMPLMWELPEISSRGKEDSVCFNLRHAITNTEYRVAVIAGNCKENMPGTWVPWRKLPFLPLTGLARKILRRAKLLAPAEARRPGKTSEPRLRSSNVERM